MRGWVIAVFLVAGFRHAAAQRWQDATTDCLGTTAQWTNDVELLDVDGDGLVDIVFANGGNYDNPGAAEATRVWRNTGGWDTAGSHCTEVSSTVVGGLTGTSRTVRAGDVDGDGDLDLVTGGGFQTQLRLYLNNGALPWTDATAQLPQQLTSIGDAEFGDVDGDGDLDLLLAEWGVIPPGAGNYVGGRTRLYTNTAGTFVDATTTQMPDILVGWSWDVELVDVDNDWDLDALVSCKLCANSRLYRNDGAGTFTDDPAAIPTARNNYEFEAMDIDEDGDLDLATINDGGSNRDRLLVNDGTGTFSDASTQLGSNPMQDDNAVVWLDADSDGDPDLFVGALGTDRLLLNDGMGVFALAANATPNDTRGTLAIAVADLDGDGRLDLVQGQGEAAFSEKVQRATDQIAIDTSPPVVRMQVVAGAIVARVHDNQSPSRAHDWTRVWAEFDATEVDLRWYGEYLWRASATPVGTVRVCAQDRRGNEGCSDDAPVNGDTTEGTDAGVLPPVGEAGGCCDTGTQPASALAPFAVLFVIARIRRRSRCSGSATRCRS